MHSLNTNTMRGPCAGLGHNSTSSASQSHHHILCGPSSSRRAALGRSSALRCSAAAASPLRAGQRQQQASQTPPGASGVQQQQRASGRLGGWRSHPLPQQHQPHQQQHPRQGVVPHAIAGTLTATGIIPLGYDFLTFLTATVMVVPTCKWLKISPVLGFLAAGVALEQAGMLKDLKDMETLSELGVLFLLYEQGLELSLDRLKALAKYAFGMGSLQVIITTLLFTAVALPAGSGLGTWFLEKVCHADPALVSIRSVDEAVVIAAALSMSSSAFVLQLLSERGESATRMGSATLGILLFQDIAIVPFLVLLPLIESNGGMEGASADTLLQMLGPTTATTLAGLGALLLGGRVVLRRVFEVVAESRSSEAFVAACLLTVGGSSLLTKQMGLSDTLGAFVAGVLLSETTFRTQVEADIRPFRGLLIGLFFLSVGGSINMEVLKDNYDVIFWMLGGLVGLKAAVNTMLGPLFGLSKSESIRTGFMLSQGGEFAFVLLSLACQLKLLPEELNQILIITVVFSMALTPALATLGSKLGDKVEEWEAAAGATSSDDELDAPAVQVDDPVVILGFGPQGQMVANMLSSPLGAGGQAYVGFDLEPQRVNAGRQAGFRVQYGDGARSDVLKAAGVKRPSAVVVCHSIPQLATQCVESIRAAYKTVPIYACAQSFKHAAELREAGADTTSVVSSEAGLNLGTTLLKDLGTPETDIALLRRGISEALAVRTAAEVLHDSESSSSSSAASAESPQPYAGPLSSIDSSSGHALMSIDGDHADSQPRKSKKKPPKNVEIFVLDGRYAYGVKPAAAAPPPPPQPASEELAAGLPCNDCPLLRDPAALQSAAAAAAAANGSAGELSNGQHLTNGAAAAAAAAAGGEAAAVSSSANSQGAGGV